MNKPINYLLVGYPYSGKTTIAKELEKRLGFSRINIDELKFAKGYTDVGDDDVPDPVWDEIFKEADNLLVRYLNEGKNVANEYAWVTKEWRDRACKVAKDAGYETKIIYVSTPKEAVLRRWEENAKTNQRFQFPRHEFEESLKSFEMMRENEKYIVYSNSDDVSDWITKYITIDPESSFS